MTAHFDFLVIGDDEASLCAAACAQKAGAKVAIARSSKSRKKQTAGAMPSVPNFIWRRLDLQDFGLTLDRVSARVTLFETGDPVVTLPGVRDTTAALADAGIGDYTLWQDFVADAAALGDSEFINSASSGAPNDGAASLANMLGDRSALHRASVLSGSCQALLDDCFEDNRLKGHIAAHALAPSGLGGAEPGSAFALTDYFNDDAWRVRATGEGRSLHDILTEVCERAGVTIYAKPLERVSSDGGKFKTAIFDDDEKLKTRVIFFATPDAAADAGAGHCAPGASIRGAGAATATVRVKLSEKIDAPAHDSDAIFQIIDGGDDLQEARDAAISGRLPERLPVEFEIAKNGDIIARSAYFPAVFFEDDEWRGWSSQDRQAAAMHIRERLGSRLPGLANIILKATIDITGAVTADSAFSDCAGVIVQPSRHNAISAAVRLIDRMIVGDS